MIPSQTESKENKLLTTVVVYNHSLFIEAENFRKQFVVTDHLSGNEYDIRYRKSKINAYVDCLSR